MDFLSKNHGLWNLTIRNPVIFAIKHAVFAVNKFNTCLLNTFLLRLNIIGQVRKCLKIFGNPLNEKNTILLPAQGYTIVRFKATNPGWWPLHCHNALHNMEGKPLIQIWKTNRETIHLRDPFFARIQFLSRFWGSFLWDQLSFSFVAISAPRFHFS